MITPYGPDTQLERRLTQLREMPVEQLYGHVLQRRSNERAGTGSPNLMRALQVVGVERLDEMEELEQRREAERERVIEADRKKKRAEEEEEEEGGGRVVEIVQMGRGINRKVKVPKAATG